MQKGGIAKRIFIQGVLQSVFELNEDFFPQIVLSSILYSLINVGPCLSKLMIPKKYEENIACCYILFLKIYSPRETIYS
jgi:hypothetical protein